MLDMDGKWVLTAVTVLSLLLSTVGVYGVSRMQSGPIFRILHESSLEPLVSEAALFTFMVGIPFLGLITAILRIDLMALGADLSNPNNLAGFTMASWVKGIGIGLAVSASILIVLWLSGRASGAAILRPAGLMTFRDAIYDEVHWTFYRAAPALLLMDAYGGVIIGAALILIETAVRPGMRFADSFTTHRHALALRLACLLASGIIYLAIQNLYVAIAVHLLISFVGNRLLLNRTGQATG